MRVGVDASCWTNGRGYGRFTRELLRFLPMLAPADEFICFIDGSVAASLELPGNNVRVVPVPQRVAPVQAASSQGSRSVADMVRFTRAVARAQLDVFFSPSVYTYFPLPPGLPAVVTVHDAIAERFPALTLPHWRARLFWQSKVRLAIWQSTLVLTVSEFSADELVRVLRVPRGRIRVTLEAAAAAYRRSDSPAAIAGAGRRAGLPPGARWFTYVGGFNPHKRLDVLVAAHAQLARELGADAPCLLLVGTAEGDVFHKDLAAIRNAIAAAGTESLVRWTGFVEDEELRHLHSGALALVLPSEAEGFGLPAVEAAACGTAVIATTESPLPRLLAGGGIFVRPGQQQELTDALRRMAMDEPARRVMATRALERAAELTWPRSAQLVLAALREAAGGARPAATGAGKRLQHAGARA